LNSSGGEYHNARRVTGRVYSAEEGQTIVISHYLVPAGGGLAKGIELAKQVAGNAPMTNFAVTHVLPWIAAADPAAGYLTEALISAIAQGDAEAKARLKAFLEKARRQDGAQLKASKRVRPKLVAYRCERGETPGRHHLDPL
jgi:hypothetical protein